MKRLSTMKTIVALAFLVSTANAGEYVSCVTISEDSSTVAFLISMERSIPRRVGALPGVARAISIAWCDSGKPYLTKRLEIDAFGQYAGELSTEFLPGCIRFSPNGHKLAVLTLHRLTVIDLKLDKELLSVDTDGRVSSFQWLSDSEIGYVKHQLKETECVICVWPPPPHTSYSRTFWVLQTLAGGRHVICSDEREYRRRGAVRRDFGGVVEAEVWSPDGRYVAYVSGREVRLLRIRDRDFKSLGRAGFDTQIYWKPDGSAVFFADSEYRVASLYKVATATLTDFSGRLEYELGGALERLVLEGWTSDGKFLVFNSWPGNGGYLVKLEPFKVVGLGGVLAQYAGVSGDSGAYIVPAAVDDSVCVYSAGVGLARFDSTGKIRGVRRVLENASESAFFAPNGRFFVTRGGGGAGIEVRKISR